MGLSIHYSGSFNPAASLEEMIEEVKDIAEIHKWKFLITETSFPKESNSDEEYDGDIYGIMISPPECEPVFLTFLSNKKMCSITGLQFFGQPDSAENEKYLYMLSTKTQYAGIEVHKQVIHLLKYISQKYLLDFQLTDEGEYWETGDVKHLEKRFALYTHLIESFASAIEGTNKEASESYEDFIARIAKMVQDKRGEK
jgi:hypothetical protein